MRAKIGLAMVLVIGLAVCVGLAWAEKAPKEKPAPPGMARIPAGCFNMGDAFNEGGYSERPVHKVCITKDFYMDVHEVTNAEYKACVDAGACTAPYESKSYTRDLYFGNPTYQDFPVINVDWNQASGYCAYVGKRLPTEAEWEYAARGGLSGKRYPWGDNIACGDACYGRQQYQPCYNYNKLPNDTQKVGSYAPNGYGLYDMAGNVWEWTNDLYADNYYSVSPTNDPTGPTSGGYRVLRGGSWDSNPGNLRVSSRLSTYFLPAGRGSDVGFRCAGD